MPLDVVVGWDEVNGKTVTFHPKSEDPFPRPPLAPPHLAIASPPFSSSPCLASPEHPRPRQRPGPSTLPPPPSSMALLLRRLIPRHYANRAASAALALDPPPPPAGAAPAMVSAPIIPPLPFFPVAAHELRV